MGHDLFNKNVCKKKKRKIIKHTRITDEIK